MENTEQDSPEYHKADISELYLAFSKIELIGLREDGTQTWKMNNICDSRSIQDVEYHKKLSEIHPYAALLRPDVLSLPIISISNDKIGPAIWILAGMYGNEPSGPNMLAQNIENIARELSDIPTVILPLCNPHGYRLNQRFLNDAVENIDGLSVDDASHVLLDNESSSVGYAEGYNPRSEAHAYEVEEIIKYLILENAIRPPTVVIDLQENDSEKGYIDSYGTKRYENPQVYNIVKAMAKAVNMTHYETSGENQWIIKSVGYPVNDNTLTEFIAAKRIVHGETAKGIGARDVIKTKVPSRYVPLEKRMQAQENALYAAIEMAKYNIGNDK